jgi:hypothetical protein
VIFHFPFSFFLFPCLYFGNFSDLIFKFLKNMAASRSSPEFTGTFTKDLLRDPKDPSRASDSDLCIGSTDERRVTIDTRIPGPTLSPLKIVQQKHFFKDAPRSSCSQRLELPMSGEKTRSLFAIAASRVDLDSDHTFPVGNGFLSACHVAYSAHLTLRLKPDDIWTCLIASVAQFIDTNAESLRADFVDFKDKAKLVVVVPQGFDALPNAAVPWPDIVYTFKVRRCANAQMIIDLGFLLRYIS